MTSEIAMLRRDIPPAADKATSTPLLEISDLRVEFDSRAGVVRAVDGASWSVAPGETIALVGESGCGKSVTALAAMRLLGRPAGRITGGRILFQGDDLLELGEAGMRQYRGKSLAMVFQEPMSSLNPLMSIGEQIMEPMLEHLDLSKRAAHERAVDLLTRVGIPDPQARMESYPHELSGGMRQRVMIAIGISCNPKLLIADEPTTALDVTIQAQILELMRSLSREMGIALVLITHNLGIVARYVDRVNIMYAGRIVESGPVEEIFARTAPSLYHRAAGLRAASGPRPLGPAGHDRRRAARSGEPARRVPVRAALCLCYRYLRHRSEAGNRRAGPDRGVSSQG